MRLNTVMEKTLPILLELGFAAVTKGDLDTAQQLFSNLKSVQPQDISAYIGQAMIFLLQGQTDLAIQELEPHVAQAGANQHEAQKFLLIAYMLQGKDMQAEQMHRLFIDKSACVAKDAETARAGQFFHQVS